MPDYVCRETELPLLGRSYEAFELTKFEDSRRPIEKYTVVRAPDGRSRTCSCQAGKSGRECKHPLFIQLLELAGLIGYMLDSETMKVHDLFPVPKGRNCPLIEVRGDF